MPFRKIYRSDRRNSSRPFGSRGMGKFKRFRYARQNQKGIRHRYRKYKVGK